MDLRLYFSKNLFSKENNVNISSKTFANFFALFDTLEYLGKGGRIGKARSLIGGLLKIRPILRVEDGEIGQFSKARSRNMGMMKLEQAVRDLGILDDIDIVYSHCKKFRNNNKNELEDWDRKKYYSNGKIFFKSQINPNAAKHTKPYKGAVPTGLKYTETTRNQNLEKKSNF